MSIKIIAVTTIIQLACAESKKETFQLSAPVVELLEVEQECQSAACDIAAELAEAPSRSLETKRLSQPGQPPGKNLT